MRSESIAWFLEKLGYSVGVLSGGYRAYRKFIRQSFLEPVKIILIGGYTGCGKTELINELSASGLQVLNLEEMANHKGSSFGHLGQGKQPTTEQFENNLYESWNRLNRSIPVYAEHESLKIGDIFLPDTFYQSMISSTMIRISLPHEIRVARLIKEYASFRKEDLAGAFVNIRKKMGAQQCKIALEALERDDFEQVVKIALLYYDKTYDMALNRRPVKTIHDLELESADMKQNALKIAEFVREKGIQ
jgi:tRNA 2-selenouridine synthase